MRRKPGDMELRTPVPTLPLLGAGVLLGVAVARRARPAALPEG